MKVSVTANVMGYVVVSEGSPLQKIEQAKQDFVSAIQSALGENVTIEFFYFDFPTTNEA